MASGVDLEPGKGDKDKLDASVRQQVITSVAYCAFYIFVSSMMVFANKSLSYTFKFGTMNMLLLIQMVFTAILLPVMRSLGFIHFDDFKYDRALQVAPVSLFYSLNGACALMALKEMSVPSYTLVKRLAPLFTIAMEFIVLGKTTTPGVLVSVGCMMVGTYIAFKDDSSSSLLGWILGFVSCLLQSLYLTYVKKSGAQSGLNTWGVLFYHSILSTPMVFLMAWKLGELEPFANYPHWGDAKFLFVFTASLFAGFLLNYSLFLCSEKTSPTSTVVSGHVKALAQTVIGFFTFGGVETTPVYLLGTCVNISGGCGYVWSKYKVLAGQAQTRK